MRRAFPLLLLAASAAAHAQESLAEMPRYDRFARVERESRRAVVGGAIQPSWAADSRSFEYESGGRRYRYDVAARAATDLGEAPRQEGRRGPERGRQNARVLSPDGKRAAVAQGRNVSVVEGGRTTAITTDGSDAGRVKYGVASWVYGEELDVTDAMWWSPDSSKLAFYRFDETGVKDYYLATDQKAFQDRLYPEAYPLPGQPNPKVSLLVWDGTRTVAVDTAFGDAALGEYVYDVRWSPDGRLLLFNRTNRRQNAMQLVAADPATGACRVVAEERQPQSWAEIHPTVRFLADGHRFVLSTERNGYVNFELRDLDGRLLRTLTNNGFDALPANAYQPDQQGVVRIDEKAGQMYYMAAGPQNPYFPQLRVVGLDGGHDRLLTDPTRAHAVSLSPDGKLMIDVAQSPTSPPETRLFDRGGKLLAVVAKADTSGYQALGMRAPEVFTYLAADGRTTLYGTISFPSDFDPTKRYPVLLFVYAGPESGGISTAFRPAPAETELGFLVVNLAGRGTTGRGKAFRDAVYGKLGIVEMDDQAAGIQALGARPYVDPSRVGVYGGSYGGYATIMLLLRHPESFACGAASSAPTDWRNYDSVYTERYMGLPGENKPGYDAGSAVLLAKDLKRPLRIYFGSSDDNVHPSNTYQFVDALERANRHYEMQVGADRGHSGMKREWMLEFFERYLVLGR